MQFNPFITSSRVADQRSEHPLYPELVAPCRAPCTPLAFDLVTADAGTTTYTANLANMVISGMLTNITGAMKMC